MVLESEFQKRYCGTYCIYKDIDDLSRAAPRFLHRNLRQSLDIKREELLRSRGRRTTCRRLGLPLLDLYSSTMKDRELTKWYPDADEIDQICRQSTLTVTPREVCLKGVAETSPPNETDSELSWLPAPGWQKLKCDVICALSHEESGSWRTSFQESHPATLHCSSTPDKGAKAVIKLDAPFVIPENVLHIPRPNKSETSHPSSQSRRTRIRFTITCPKSSAQQDLHRLFLESDDTGERGAVQAYIYDIEKFTGADDSTSVNLLGDFKRYAMHVGLAWNSMESTCSTLTTFKEAKAILEPANNRLALTPDGATDIREHVLKYVFSESGEGTKAPIRILVATNLACPLCTSRLPQSSFQRLRFHYLLSHDHFRFDLHEHREVDGVLSATIHVSLQDPRSGRVSNDTPDLREMTWVRPNRPFDLDRYLKGDDAWGAGQGPSKKTAHKSPSRDGGLAQAIGYWGPKAPDAVEKLEPFKQKRFPVPNIPGVVLYRSLNKRKLRAGEELSESDEYSDTETWAARKQRKRTPPILGYSQGAFFELWDNFVRREKIASDVHVTDALVRFCARYRRELKRPSMAKDFNLKLEQLHLTGRITDEARIYCEKTLEQTETPSWHDDKDGLKREVQIYCGNGAEQTDDQDKRDSAVEDGDFVHPLTSHPKVKSWLDKRALHPDINPHLTTIVFDEDLRNRRSTLSGFNADAHKAFWDRCGHLIQDSTEDRLDRSDTPTDKTDAQYREWISTLKAKSESKAIRGHKTGLKLMAGLCICGRAAVQDRGIIMCANAKCKRGAFHLACVNLAHRDPHWKCKACSKGGARERSTEWVTKKEEGAEYPIAVV